MATGSLITITPLTDGPVHTAADHNTPNGQIASLLNGGIGTVNIVPKGLDASVLADSVNPVVRDKESGTTYIVQTATQGFTIATNATLSTTMIGGTAYVNGTRLTIANTPITVVASKDTYIYLKDDGTVVTNNNVANNTTSPTASTNSDGSNAMLIGIIISSGTAITSVNQGSTVAVLPLVSSVAYSVTDGLGNLIYPTSPNPKLIGYRQIITNPATISSSTFAAIAGLVCPVINVLGKQLRVRFYISEMRNSSAGTYSYTAISDGTVSGGVTGVVANGAFVSAAANSGSSLISESILTPTTATKTYIAAQAGDNIHTTAIQAASYAPAFLSVEVM